MAKTMPRNDIEKRIYELFSTDSVLGGKNGLLARDTNGDLAVYLSQFEAIGARFPQVCFHYMKVGGEEVLPAEEGVLHVRAYASKDSADPSTVMRDIINRVEEILNRNNALLDDIDHDSNDGLQVVQCYSVERSNDKYDINPEIFYEQVIYQITKSDNAENYKISYGNEDTEWP